MFGAMVMLLGLQLMGPALLASTGYFDRVLALFPPELPVMMSGLAVAGALTMLTGFVLFMQGLRART